MNFPMLGGPPIPMARLAPTPATGTDGGYPWVDGELLYAADLNAAFADSGLVSNVLDDGADPTGSTDSTSAFAAAVATGGNVYVPPGNYLIRNQLTVSNGQELFGDGRGKTTLLIDQTFSSTALAVIALTGLEQLAPTVRDLRISFAQPSDQASRANFRTLAAGGTSGLGGTGVMYPPAIGIRGANRFRLRNLRIDGAWDGIINATGTGNIGGFIIENIEMGALNCGLSIDNVLDFGHIKTYHFWPFGLNAGVLYTSVFADGNTFGAKFGANGQANGINLTDFCVFQGRVSLATAGTWVHAINMMMDSNNATLEISGCSWALFSNIYFSGHAVGANANAQITVASGNVFINNMFASTSVHPVINLTGGRLMITNSYIGGDFNIPAVNSSGTLEASGNVFAAGGSPWTQPVVNVTGGICNFHNNRMDSISPGNDAGMLWIATDNALHSVVGNYWNGWQWNPPGKLGNYGFNSDMVANVSYVEMAGSAIVGNATGGATSLRLQAAAGNQRAVNFESGAALRWAILVPPSSESGSNVGSDFAIVRYNDAGTQLGLAPLSIVRSTGIISLPTLQASTTYANDAAAATGGVPVGGLYRNGSVVQVRVT